MPLKNVVSSALVPQNASEGMLTFAEKGQKAFEEYFDARLLSQSKISMCDKMTKMKIKTFSNQSTNRKVFIKARS